MRHEHLLLCSLVWRALKHWHLHHERIELTELCLLVGDIATLHRGLLQSLQALLLHNQRDLVVCDAVQLLKLLRIAMVSQLFDVFDLSKVWSISAILFLFHY